MKLFSQNVKLIHLTCVCLMLFSGCRRHYEVEVPALSRINIIDREGFVSTIQTADRLRVYQNVDFHAPQAYEKVMGVYHRDPNGTIRSFIASYYPNGQLHQWLDVMNGRANGTYQEWHENGLIKLQAQITGGEADLTEDAMRSWIFEGKSQAWNTQGTLEAQFTYCTGKLEGEALEYHPNQTIRKRMHYHEHALEGIEEIYDDKGLLLESNEYLAGVRHGVTNRYWASGILMAQERFEKDCLCSGKYFDRKGQIISAIEAGSGFRIIFDHQRIRTREQYKNGFPEGLVELFDANGVITQSYHQKYNKKNGEEIFYYPVTSQRAFLAGEIRPKISLMWVDDQLQGLVKTWYDNGQIESQREMSQNIRNGISNAWYRNGRLMLMEEYEQDKLIKGEYFRRNERLPVSLVNDGTGEATIYDADGNLVRKIQYFRSHAIDI